MCHFPINSKFSSPKKATCLNSDMAQNSQIAQLFHLSLLHAIHYQFTHAVLLPARRQPGTETCSLIRQSGPAAAKQNSNAARVSEICCEDAVCLWNYGHTVRALPAPLRMFVSCLPARKCDTINSLPHEKFHARPRRPPARHLPFNFALAALAQLRR